jgi:hypothetical protein
MEHRWGQRIPLGHLVRLDARPACMAFGVLRDASLSGGYVETAANVPVQARLHLELEWIYWSRAERCRIAAYVVRVDEHGIAVEWCDFAPASIGLLISPHMKSDDAASQDRLVAQDAVSRLVRTPPASPAERPEQL